MFMCMGYVYFARCIFVHSYNFQYLNLVSPPALVLCPYMQTNFTCSWTLLDFVRWCTCTFHLESAILHQAMHGALPVYSTLPLDSLHRAVYSCSRMAKSSQNVTN